MKIASLALVLLLLGACARERPEIAEARRHGDAERGREAFLRYGCNDCHVVAGLETKTPLGPALGSIEDRPLVAGVVPHTPDTLTAFIRNPRTIKPATRMPGQGVTEQEARDIAAFLYAQ